MTLADEIEAAVAAVRRGEVIALPTETVYGIGADPYLPEAARRVFAAKGRPENVALPVLVAEPGDAERLALIGAGAARLAARYWPGPLTLVLARRPGIELHLGGDPATVGVRCPDHDVARALLRRTGPLAVTSANPHGSPPATTAEQVRLLLGDDVAAVVDAGPCDGSPSTVVAVTPQADLPLQVFRQGALTEAELLEALTGPA